MSEVKTAEISVQENIVPCRSSQGNYTDIFRLKSKVLSWTEWCPPPPPPHLKIQMLKSLLPMWLHWRQGLSRGHKVKWCHELGDLHPKNQSRQWHPTPVLLPGKSRGWRSLVGCSPWGREESDTTEWLPFHFSLSCIGEGNGNPLQCSCLENPRDGGAWWAVVCGITQSRTRLKWLGGSSSMQRTYVLIRSGRHARRHPPRGKALWEFAVGMAIFRPRREASGETNPASTSILDFETLEQWRDNVLWLKHSLWYLLAQPELTQIARKVGKNSSKSLRNSTHNTWLNWNLAPPFVFPSPRPWFPNTTAHKSSSFSWNKMSEMSSKESQTSACKMIIMI